MDEELSKLSLLDTFDVDRPKALYSEEAIEIVWKVKNPFESEVSA